MKWIAAVVLLSVLGCADIKSRQSPPERPYLPLGAELTQNSRSVRNALLLRHSVRLRIPGYGLDQTFSGMMRFDNERRSVRLVGIAGFGMKLFDLSISRDGVETHFISPGLNRITNLAEHVAFCVRRIWLNHQPEIENELPQIEETLYQYETHDGQLIEHEFLKQIRRATRALGPREYWEILHSERMANTREPSRIIFKDGHGRYALDVHLVEQRMTSP